MINITKDALQAIEVDTEKKAQDILVSWVNRTYAYMEKYHYPAAVNAYEEQQHYMGRRLLDLIKQWQGWAANQKYPLSADAHKIYTWMLLALDLQKVDVQSFYPSLDKKDQKFITAYKHYARHFFSLWNNRTAWEDCIEEVVWVGTAYGRVKREEYNMDIVTKVNKKKDGTIEYETKEHKRWNAVLEHVSFFDVLPSPSMHGQIWVRSFEKLSHVEYMYDVDKETMDKIKKWWYISNNNRKNVKRIGDWEAFLKKETAPCINAQMTGGQYDLSTIPDHDAFFSIVDKDLVEVVTIYVEWERGKIYEYVLANRHLIHAEKSKIPINKLPIRKVTYNRIAWEEFGRWIYEDAKSYQKACDTLYNTWLTASLIASAPMFTMAKDFNNPMDHIHYEPFKIITMSQWIASLDRLNIIDYQALQQNLWQLNEITNKFYNSYGLNQYVTGWQGGIEKSAKWVAQRTAWTTNKFLKTIRALNDFASDILHIASAYDKVYGEDIITDIVEEETWKKITISTEDLVNTYKISFNADDIVGDKQLDLQDSIALMQNLWWFDMDPETWEPVIDRKAWLEHIMKQKNMSNVVPSYEDKLNKTQEAVNYITKKREITKWIQPQEKPIDKTFLNLDFKDFTPEDQQAIMSMLGLKPDQAWNSQLSPEAAQKIQQQLQKEQTNPTEEKDILNMENDMMNWII